MRAQDGAARRRNLRRRQELVQALAFSGEPLVALVEDLGNRAPARPRRQALVLERCWRPVLLAKVGEDLQSAQVGGRPGRRARRRKRVELRLPAR
jgi:hypothetical protein